MAEKKARLAKAAQSDPSQRSFDYHRLVIKLGTNLVTTGDGCLDLDNMANLAGQVARLHQQGLEIILVSSGAIAAGRDKLGLHKDRRDIPEREVMAAVGQGRLMYTYE